MPEKDPYLALKAAVVVVGLPILIAALAVAVSVASRVRGDDWIAIGFLLQMYVVGSWIATIFAGLPAYAALLALNARGVGHVMTLGLALGALVGWGALRLWGPGTANLAAVLVIIGAIQGAMAWAILRPDRAGT